MAISDYSTTPTSNTSISGIDINENCDPDGINNAIRQMMADIKSDAYYTGGTDVAIADGGTGASTAAAARNNLKIAFAASLTASQTGIASATDTKVVFGTENFDHGSYYDTTTSRWTPPAGVVRISSATLISAGIVDQSRGWLTVYKNGAAWRSGSVVGFSGTNNQSLSVDVLAEANGTDYFEIYINVEGAGTKTVFAGQWSWFVGEVV